MSLLTFLGILLVIIGTGLIGISLRYFYLGIQELSIEKQFSKGIFKRY